MEWLMVGALAVLFVDLVVVSDAMGDRRRAYYLLQVLGLLVIATVLLGALWSPAAAALVAALGSFCLVEWLFLHVDKEAKTE